MNLSIKSKSIGEFKLIGIILASAIFLIFGFYLLHEYGIFSKNLPDAENRSGMSTQSTVKSSSVSRKEKKSNSKSFVYPEYVKRDPFRQKVSGEVKAVEVIPKSSEPLPLLTGIIWDSEKPIAILEDKNKKTSLVKVNEMVNSYKVSAISNKGVVLEKDKQRYELRIWNDEEKLKDAFSLK